MIRKLQIKFVVINMTIVTIMLFAILGLVYHLTQRNLETESIHMMKSIAANPFQLDRPDDPPENLRLPFFILRINPEGELVSAEGGYYDLSDKTFLNSLIAESIESRQDIGIISEHNLRYCRVQIPRGMLLVFSDMSSEKRTLDNLVKSFALIGSFSFLAFLGLSILLAKWAIRPVEKAWNQQKQFVADASHELKTPLTVIMTNTELLQSPQYTEQERKKFLSSISLMSEQMKQLVEHMLLLAKSDNQQDSISMTKIDFSKLVLNSVISFEGIFMDKGLMLEDFIAPDIFIHGNKENLQQAVDILLDNAQKYSHPNTRTSVTLSNKEWNTCCLKISNYGNPISPEDLTHIFGRFYRIDKARSRDGSFGLGLSIAKSIVTRHKGKIWAESKNGINSFFIELHRI